MLRRHGLLGAARVARGVGLAPPGPRATRCIPHPALRAPRPTSPAWTRSWTTAAVTRNFGLLVYDTLYGIDGTLTPRPQMAHRAHGGR